MKWGIFSGALWGLDTSILALALVFVPFLVRIIAFISATARCDSRPGSACLYGPERSSA